MGREGAISMGKMAVNMVGGPTYVNRFCSFPFNLGKPLFPLAGRPTVHRLVVHCKTVVVEPNIPCDNCKGMGWLVCDYCEGQKINVQAKNSRFHRRCPSCRAAGVVICPRCKVFKCVSFPDENDAVVVP